MGGAGAVAGGGGGNGGGVGDARAPDASDAQEGAAPDPSDFVFDDKKLSEWRLTLAPADLKKLNDTALMELYVPATLRVDNDDVGEVAVRYKGGFASFRACFSQGVNTCKKLSYKIDFAEYIDKKRFYGLKKINLHSQKLDQSHLHERLAYKLFRQHGVVAPRSAHAKVFVNDVYKGLFGLTEDVDGRFARVNWPEAGDGNLYKETWPLSADPKFYVAGQKTNEPDPLNLAKNVVPPTKILEFRRQLYAAAPADVPALLDQWFGLDHLFRVLAIDHAITNWDGPLTFYCFPNCTNHNFYIYESALKDRLWLVPWDLDVTFALTDPRETAIMTPWDQPPADCNRRYLVFPPSTNMMHPGCDRVYRGLAQAGRERFVAAVDAVLAGPFNVAAMRADLDAWAAQIEPAVRMDVNGPGYMPWMFNVAAMRRDLDRLREKLMAIRDGRKWTPTP